VTKLAVDARERPDELHRAPLAETRYLTFNTRKPPLNDPRVRRALSLAIDRRRIVDDVLHGGQDPSDRLLSPALGSETGSPNAGPLRRPDEARSLLAAAGFPGGRGFPRLELSEPVSWRTPPVLETIQAMWKETLGVRVDLAVREARVHVANIRSGSYDIAFITLIPDVPDPVAALERFTSGSPDNYPHWSDPGYDRLVTAAAEAADPAGRNRLLRAAESRLLEAQPLAPLYFNTQNWLMRPWVHGWAQDALWNRYYPGLWLDKL